MVSAGSARSTATPRIPGTVASRAARAAAGAAGPGSDTGEPAADRAATWSVIRFSCATGPNVAGSLASCVLIATTATVVMNSARTRPLTARKAALGLSPMRRAASRVAGRLVHRAIAAAAAMVSHGPAMNRPTRMMKKLDANAWTCPDSEAG